MIYKWPSTSEVQTKSNDIKIIIYCEGGDLIKVALSIALIVRNIDRIAIYV